MKLLTYTSRIQLFFFLMLFGGFSILFYLVLSWNVLQNVDEVLYNRKINLLAYLKENPQAPFTEDNPLDDFTFYPVDQRIFQKGREIYADTLVYEPVDDELDEYRKLTTYVELHGNYYRLEIVKPHLEVTEIVGTIAITLGGLFLGMTLCYYLSQRFISRKIWNPFYEMLEKLRHYRLDQQIPVLSHSRIDEFRTLRDTITELMQKNKEVFDSQKQFIENASHEMQTPLSVIQSRLEALISQEELTFDQAAIIESIIGSTQRLKKLNKTLLLLSKIENRQFLLTEEISVNGIIDRSLAYYEEQKVTQHIEVIIKKEGELIVQGNTMLTEILVQNLLKNAFLHNIRNGKVIISIMENRLSIANTGNQRALDKEKLFRRFYKQSGNPDTWGLGLAIVHKITEVSGWSLHYEETHELYVFEVVFK
ncbi:sensor histidine kinase [Sinomicrobium weinanense]|uniref:histidine kinase n=1 Tax=Sinomicrobium weinanense TaxID=2842200 RepID=A0A926Q0C4_9FLAO|nr:HAMP domain-containing sensor histidine kinase [Sinomicrobium weinanense]MBC9794693.1 HAMP domain-containing histidine kinase [Sinomicrobium weinanense]MBU3124178.1 HAMP domain-containing histidine kinase [Sinomicrobium weinanense]